MLNLFVCIGTLRFKIILYTFTYMKYTIIIVVCQSNQINCAFQMNPLQLDMVVDVVGIDTQRVSDSTV